MSVYRTWKEVPVCRPVWEAQARLWTLAPGRWSENRQDPESASWLRGREPQWAGCCRGAGVVLGAGEGISTFPNYLCRWPVRKALRSALPHGTGMGGSGHSGQPALPKGPAPTAHCKNQSFKTDNQRPQEWLCVMGGRHCGVLGLDYTTHCATCVCHTTAADTGGSSESPTWGLILLCPLQDIGQGPQQPLLALSGDLGQCEGSKAPLGNNSVPHTCGVLSGKFSSLDQQSAKGGQGHGEKHSSQAARGRTVGCRNQQGSQQEHGSAESALETEGSKRLSSPSDLNPESSGESYC